MLTDIVAENRKLKLDGAQQLEGLMKGVQDAISQLQAETKRRNDIVQHQSEAVQGLISKDIAGLKPSWEDMEELSIHISSLANEVRLSASDQMLLNSLHFDYMAQRQATVEPAHEQTFEWVLDPSSPVKFDDWLRFQDGIYWINGKAGSGKSTLMKFLLNHIKTAESLKSWAGPERLVTASFFFWNAGTSIQKSQEGLFRSLLYEILSQCPELIRTVCSSKAKNFRPFREEYEPWTRQELWHAVAQLKDQSGAKARFCFFIDGLDEYDGESDHIVSVLESLRDWPNVKLCVSSRPYNEFRDAFGRPSDPQLALEDLTREDIKLYISSTLEANSHFKALKARDDRSQELVQDIVEKAQGVFLWVILVVRSLLTGLRNADRLYDLQKRLRDFPETLDRFFSHMIASIEPIYREQTAQAFKFALEAERPLSLMTYSFLDEEDLDDVVTAPLDPLTSQEILSRQDNMRRRLNGRCKGLLEVVSISPKKSQMRERNIYVNQFQAPTVLFHHRTVRDFLHTKDMQNMLLEYLEPSFEPKSRICKALLRQLKAIKYSALEGSEWLPRRLLHQLTHYAARLEDETRVSETSLIDEVGRCVLKHAGLFGWNKGRIDFLEYLVMRRLHLYIAETLTTTTSLTHSDMSSLLGSTLGSGSQPIKPPFDAEMVDLLLRNGAQPNDKYGSSTVWGNFLLFLAKYPTYSRKDGVLTIIESLLSHGANLQQHIVTGVETRTREMSERGVHSQEHLEVQSNIVKSAQQILLEELGEEKTLELIKKARKDQMTRPVKSKWWLGRSLRASMKALKR